MNANVVSLSARRVERIHHEDEAHALPRREQFHCSERAPPPLLLTLALPAKSAYQPAAEGSHLAVATDNADATRAALTVMRNGGNAFDGAIAASLALGVSAPSASGIGGGGFALVWVARERKMTRSISARARPRTEARRRWS